MSFSFESVNELGAKVGLYGGKICMSYGGVVWEGCFRTIFLYHWEMVVCLDFGKIHR